MNLKTYNAQNAPHKVAPKVNRRLTFSFNDKGKFTIGRILYEKMGSPAGVVVLQDTQYPSDFYLRVSKDPMAFLLKNGSKNQFIFKSNTLAGIMAGAIHITPPLYIEIQCVRKGRRTFLHRYQEACRQETVRKIIIPMYFCNLINYNLSELKAVDRDLLPLVKPLIHYSVSKVWIEEFRDFLIKRQQLFLEKNRRAKQVDISSSFHCDWPHNASTQGHYDSACLRCGSIYVNFVWIKDELYAFGDKNSYTAYLDSLIR